MGCRPIVSSINAPTTGLSKWIATQIQSDVRDADTLQGEVIQLTVETTDMLYTFDVENMYTSIPIAEALHAVRWFLTRMQHPLSNLLLYGLRTAIQLFHLRRQQLEATPRTCHENTGSACISHALSWLS